MRGRRGSLALVLSAAIACTAPGGSRATPTGAPSSSDVVLQPTSAPTARATPIPTARATPAATPAPVPKDPVLADTAVQSGLRIPWDLAFAPDGRMFVTERAGNVLIFESGATSAPRIGHFSVPAIRQLGESGLMGIALDPDFARNGLLYVCASRTDEGEFRNQVLRLRATGNEIALEGYVIRTGMRAAAAHDGCTVRVGPDRKLWVSMGDSTLRQLARTRGR